MWGNNLLGRIARPKKSAYKKLQKARNEVMIQGTE